MASSPPGQTADDGNTVAEGPFCYVTGYFDGRKHYVELSDLKYETIETSFGSPNVGATAFVVTLFRIMGIWAGSGPRRIVTVSVLTLIHTVGIGMVVDAWSRRGSDVVDVTESLYTTICNLMVSSKIYCIIFAMHNIAPLMTIMDSAFANASANKDMVAAAARSLRVSKIFFGFCMFTGIGFGLYPITDFMIFGPRGQVVGVGQSSNSTDSPMLWPLPFRVWAPWNQMESPWYQITYFMIAAHCSLMGFFIPAGDLLVASPVLLACGLLRVVQGRLRRLVPNTETTLMPYVLEYNADEEMKEEEPCGEERDGYMASVLNKTEITKNGGSPNFQMKLGRVVREHQAIIEFISRLNDSFKIMLFIQFGWSLLLICLNSFQCLLSVPGTLDFAFKVSYLGVAASEVFVLCWAGEQFLNECEQVAEAVYACSWYSTSPSSRRLLHMILLRAQKPVFVEVGKFGVLSMSTFAGIMQTSYSYLAVLREMLN